MLSRRGIFPRIAILLLLGALSTTAVAWLFACLHFTPKDRLSSGQQIHPIRGPVIVEIESRIHNGLTTTVHADPGRIRVIAGCYGPDWTSNVGGSWVQGNSDTPPDQLVPRTLHSLALPWLHGRDWPSGASEENRSIEASGWPFLALASEHRLEEYPRPRYGMTLNFLKPRIAGYTIGWPRQRTLPLYPLLPGLLIDTLIYAMIWGALHWIWHSCRADSRRLRGQCPSCAYDLRNTPPTAPCPECGTPANYIDPQPRRPSDPSQYRSTF